MIEINKKGYFPLKKEHVDLHVPSQPGVFALAVHLANGTYHPFYTAESENLRDHLKNLLGQGRTNIPEEISEHLHSYQCFFTFYITNKNEIIEAVEKLLAETNDPVVRLKIFTMN